METNSKTKKEKTSKKNNNVVVNEVVESALVDKSSAGDAQGIAEVPTLKKDVDVDVSVMDMGTNQGLPHFKEGEAKLTELKDLVFTRVVRKPATIPILPLSDGERIVVKQIPKYTIFLTLSELTGQFGCISVDPNDIGEAPGFIYSTQFGTMQMEPERIKPMKFVPVNSGLGAVSTNKFYGEEARAIASIMMCADKVSDIPMGRILSLPSCSPINYTTSSKDVKVTSTMLFSRKTLGTSKPTETLFLGMNAHRDLIEAFLVHIRHLAKL